MKRCIELYKKEIIPQMKKDFGFQNIYEVPKIEKISLNCGLGKFKDNHETITKIAKEIYLISGQKPRICKSKKAISGFKLRQGEIIGLNLTLRGPKMYQFLDKLLNVVIPRIKDFRGLSTKAFDQNGNYTFAIHENIAFPEINYEKIEDIYGLQFTVVMNTKNKKEALTLLKNIGFPFKKEDNRS